MYTLLLENGGLPVPVGAAIETPIGAPIGAAMPVMGGCPNTDGCCGTVSEEPEK